MKLPYQLGDIIKERYRIINILGEGGTAVTYEAEDTKHDRTVAIKVLSLYESQEWKVIELFEREAKVLANLNHPHIPQYYDYFYLDLESDRHFFIVQELIVGKSLKTLVDQGWRFQEAEVSKIAQQVLEILNYLHSLKPAVIHRDIKPHNLIQTEAGDIYLVDFGAVQDVYRNTVTRGATFVGTIDYMSPEQIRGQTSMQSDLYSLGCTLLFLLTRRSPSELPITRMKLDFRQKLQLSDSFAAWLDKILEPVPEDRFSSAADATSKLKQKNRDYGEYEYFDYGEHRMPISGSKIELKRNPHTLVIEIPPKRKGFLQNVYWVALLAIPVIILIWVFSILGSIKWETSPEMIIFNSVFIAAVFLCLFTITLHRYCLTTSLRVKKGILQIQHQIWKFRRVHKIPTNRVKHLEIVTETSATRNNEPIAFSYFLAIHDGNKKYTFGHYLDWQERNWILEEVASQIESFYPGTRIPSNDYTNIWFKNNVEN